AANEGVGPTRGHRGSSAWRHMLRGLRLERSLRRNSLMKRVWVTPRCQSLALKSPGLDCPGEVSARSDGGRGVGAHLQTLRSDRPYKRVNITGLTSVTAAQHVSLLALGPIEPSVRHCENSLAVTPVASRLR